MKNEPTHVVADEIGDSTPYLTVGRVYPVEEWRGEHVAFTILDDDGFRLRCLLRGCAHLDGHPWRAATPAEIEGSKA